MIPRRSNRSRAFSLVEMMAAVLIFGIGVIATLEAIGVSLQSTTDSLGYTRAVFLAQQQLEETISQPPLSALSDSGDFGEGFPNYSWRREVEETVPDRLYRVSVVVRWNERGRDRQFSLTTLAANRQ